MISLTTRTTSIQAIYLVFDIARWNINTYTTFTFFRVKYLVMCKVYTDVGDIK